MMLCKVGSIEDVKKYHLKWLAQKKIDGVRCWASIGNEGVKLTGRSGSDYTSKFPEIVDELKTLNFRGVLDGEIVCDDFDKTASRVHTENKLKSSLLVKEYPAKLWIFDIVPNEANKGVIYSKRLEILTQMALGFKNYLKLIGTTNDLISLWERAKNDNWEGIIIKNPFSVYEHKRSGNCLKIKYIKSRDVKVESYEINPAGIKINGEGITCQISGEKSKDVKKLFDETGSAVIEVNYLNVTESGALRMPVFKCLK